MDTSGFAKSFHRATLDFLSALLPRENPGGQPNCACIQSRSVDIMYILIFWGLRCQADGTCTFGANATRWCCNREGKNFTQVFC